MLWAVVMAGGFGTRFWPESRRKAPKQFLHFFSQKTLLEETVERLQGVIPPSRVFVITQQDKVSLCRKLLKKVPASHIIGEPIGRNTAPCAAIAAALAAKKDPNAIIALLPADHRIEKKVKFQKALKAAESVAAKSDYPVTFGIKPSFPHTGYGYLELNKQTQKKNGLSFWQLKRFREKPALVQAKKFCRSKKFLWNSGMFVWKCEGLLKAVNQYLPKVAKVTEQIVARDFKRGMKRYFKNMPSISIDYGLMEKLKGKILTCPVDIGWNDLGGWKSLEDLCKADNLGNIAFGDSLVIGSTGNIIRSKKRLVAMVGVKDHIVVDTDDAVLICHKDSTESIREIVAQLKKSKLNQYL